jgi:DNA polymerase
VTDVTAEQGLDSVLPELTPFEQEVYAADLRMNGRGIPVDLPNVEKVAEFLSEYREQIKASTDAPITSAQGFKTWLNERGCNVTDIQKDTLARCTDYLCLKRDVLHAIECRQKIQQASVKKLDKMIACAIDGRVYGTEQYLGAQRTGRWAGRLVQPQNLTRGTHNQAEKDEFFDLIENINSLKLFEAFYASPSAIASSALRGFIKAPEGKKFLIADYSAIEARVLAWLAGDEGLLDLFNQGVDVYVALSAKIYGIPISEVTDEQRRLGKQAILGLGYQMGQDKFHSTCTETYHLDVDRGLTDKAHRVWRSENVITVKFWRKIENAVRITTRTGRESKLNGLTVRRDKFGTHIELPSERKLHYPEMRYRDEGLEFWGQYQGKFIWVDTYGGKLAENVTQAIARDLMANSLLELEKEDWNPVFLVHDEGICEVSMDFGTLDMLSSIMCRVPSWAEGVPMDVGGFECIRYRKD